MCFVNLKTAKFLIAKEDIKVVKYLREDLKSLFFDFYYQLNKVYTEKIETSWERKFFSSDLELQWIIALGIEDYAIKYTPKLSWYGRGFHSLTINSPTLTSIQNLSSSYIGQPFNAIIPKGSEYQICPFGTVISNKIKIISQFIQ